MRDGDWIEVGGRPRRSRSLRRREVANLTTSATVTATGGLPNRVVTAVALIVVLGTLLVIVAVIVDVG